MFSKELESLIQATLVDGKIDDVEKKALLSRAKKEGVDPDELEVYINSLLQKRILSKTAEEDALEAKQREIKQNQVGVVCPYCGNPLPPMAESCPLCGQIILTAAVNEKIEKEMDEIIQLTKAFPGEAKSRLIKFTIKYASVPKVQVFAKQMQSQIRKSKLTVVWGICGLLFILCLIGLVLYATGLFEGF